MTVGRWQYLVSFQCRPEEPSLRQHVVFVFRHTDTGLVLCYKYLGSGWEVGSAGELAAEVGQEAKG